jgi:hypothetical protein
MNRAQPHRELTGDFGKDFDVDGAMFIAPGAKRKE